MTESDLAPILAYLRENHGRYSLAALRRQLLENGSDPVDVDWAIRIFQQENPAARPRVWPKALLVLAVNAVLAAITAGVGAARGGDVLSALGLVLFLLGCAEFLAGFVLAFPEKTRLLGFGLLFGFFLSVGLGILALGGVCVYFLSQGNFN